MTVHSETTKIVPSDGRENGVQSPISGGRWSRSGRSADRQQQQHHSTADRDFAYNHHRQHHQQQHQSRPVSRSSSGSNVNILKELSKLSQLNLYRLTHHHQRGGAGNAYSVLSSVDSVTSASDALHQNMVKSQSANVIAATRGSSLASPAAVSGSAVASNASPPGSGAYSYGRMPRDPMSVPNFGVALTPVEATKLVYLEDEEAPSPRVEIDHDFGSVHMRFHPNGPSSSVNKTMNRRSYPMMTTSASARFGNPYSTPEEPGDITSGYVSIETVHQSPCGDGPMCFSNPNYMVADIQNAISKGMPLLDYIKVIIKCTLNTTELTDFVVETRFIKDLMRTNIVLCKHVYLLIVREASFGISC